MNWFEYVRRGLAVVTILKVDLPKALADGKLSVKEITDILVKICIICHWNVTIDIPQEISGTIIGITGDFED